MVSYYKVSDCMNVNVPVSKQYEISGNNMVWGFVMVQE